MDTNKLRKIKVVFGKDCRVDYLFFIFFYFFLVGVKND
jgi:hypothetical protein